MSAPIPEDHFKQEKYCCSGCAQKRRCHVCDDVTDMACSDCRIDLGMTIYVCKKSFCRDHHESKCGYQLRDRIAALEAQLKEAIAVQERMADNGILRINETVALEAQVKTLRQHITSEESMAVLGPDKLPGDATFRIAACGFFDLVMNARAALTATEPKEAA